MPWELLVQGRHVEQIRAQSEPSTRTPANSWFHGGYIPTVANCQFPCFHLNPDSFSYCKNISSKFDLYITKTLKIHIFLFEDLGLPMEIHVFTNEI